jgi:signal-transduction protein with cAMP-binding, CBS, and nucleotidyltransferase domain
MSSPVITINESKTANRVGQLMEKNNIGCIIVNSEKGKPIGIITEKDLVERVIAKDIQPRTITAKQIMSAPLNTIYSNKSISDAARRMNILNVRRLPVMYKGSLAGIITSKDILAVTPELIEIIQEKARLENQKIIEESESLKSAGYCDNCRTWSDSLKEIEGNFLCEECQIELKNSDIY